jgi:ubiquinol-cytochrome c reductase cytochrome c subunit
MWRSALAAAALALAAWAAAAAAVPRAAAQGAPIPQSPGWELVMRCVICHSVEIAVQQRFGPMGWSDTLDRMIKYGAPIPPEDKEKLLAYLLQHFRDPEGR